MTSELRGDNTSRSGNPPSHIAILHSSNVASLSVGNPISLVFGPRMPELAISTSIYGVCCEIVCAAEARDSLEVTSATRGLIYDSLASLYAYTKTTFRLWSASFSLEMVQEKKGSTSDTRLK